MKTLTKLGTLTLAAMATCAVLSGCGMTSDEKEQLAVVQADMTRKQTFFVLTKNLESGHTIVPEDFEPKEIIDLKGPYNGIPIDFQIKEKEKQNIVGRKTTRYLAAGTLLEFSDLYDKEEKPAAGKETKPATPDKH
ncbi:MAG: hypothetical protein U0105_21580 [Candidatus Obscuribacterales bacterium]